MFNSNLFVSRFCRIFERSAGWKLLGTVCFGLCLAPSMVVQAAPAYDVCTGAISIPGGGPFPHWASPVSIADATVSGNEVPLTNTMNGFCSFPVSRGVWYSFTPASTAFYVLSTCTAGTTVGDTVLAIFTSTAGCGGTFTRIDCSDDSCGPGGFQSSITRQLLKDTMYYVVIWQWDTEEPEPGLDTLQLLVDRVTPPENDTCANAQPVFLNTRIAGSTSLGSNDYQLSGAACFTGVGQAAVTAAGRDVAFSFTAPEAGTYSVKAYNYPLASGYDLVLYVATGCPSGSTPITLANCLAAANRNAATTAEEVSCLPLTAGQQIFIIVDDAVSTNLGSSFTLEVTQCRWEAEPNNFVTNATIYDCGIEGSMFPGSDVDFYSLGSFPAGSRLFALLDGEAANLPDFDLRVTSTTDTLEFDRDDNDALFAHSSPNLAGTPLSSGPAYLRLNYSDPFGLGFTAEPYRLYAVVQPPMNAAAAETEPNGSIATANSDTRLYFRGNLDGPAPSSDTDVYRFVAEEGDLVFVGLDGDPMRNNTPINAQLELLDSFGNPLVLVNDANSASFPASQPGDLAANVPSSPAEALAYRCSEGAYFVRVGISPTATGATGAGDYLLSISRNCVSGAGAQPPQFLGLTNSVDGHKVLTLQGTPWAIYRIEWSSNLTSWFTLTSVVANGAGLMTAEDAAPAPDSRFYRAVAP